MTDEQRTCPETGQTLLLAAGELPASEEVVAREHLESCPACRVVAAAVREVEGRYADAPVPSLEEEEVGELLRRATARSSGEGTAPLRSAWGRRALARGPWLAAAAAVVAVVAGGVVFGSWPGTDESVGPSRGGVEVASMSPLERFAVVQEAGRRGDAGRLLDLLEREPNPNVRLAILDALARSSHPGDPRLLDVLENEPMPPLRIDILDLAARKGIVGVQQAAERLAREDGSATVRARASLILSEL
ncbi:MAG: zf-HC2 domain-containing protein [Gemmatimonadota bacterium]|jgi:hypothetical protein